MVQQIIHIEANVPWKCFRGSGGNWVGACEPLKLTLQASTWAELMEDIALTLDAIFKDLLTTNELQTFLRDRGWVLSGTMPTRPEDVRFDVPFIPAIVSNHGFQRELH